MMDIAKLLLVCSLLLGAVAHAACSRDEVLGPWAFMGQGSNETSSDNSTDNSTDTSMESLQGIGVVNLRRGGVATVGWVVAKHDDELWHAENLTGTYTLNDTACAVWANFTVEGTNLTFYGTIARGKNLIHAVSVSDTIEVIGTFVSLRERGCNANSISGRWNSALLSTSNDTTDAILETLNCTRDSCSLQQVPIMDNAENNTDIAVTFGPNPPFWCRFTFANDSALAGYIAVPYGNGMFALQTSSNSSVATTFYRSAATSENT